MIRPLNYAHYEDDFPFTEKVENPQEKMLEAIRTAPIPLGLKASDVPPTPSFTEL